MRGGHSHRHSANSRGCEGDFLVGNGGGFEVAFEGGFGGEALMFKAEAEVDALEARERTDALWSGFGFGRMAVDGGLHGLPFLIPHVSATAGTEESGVPELFMEFSGIAIGIKALPFVEDREVVPGKELLLGCETLRHQSLEDTEDLLINFEAEIGAKPWALRVGRGCAGSASVVAIESAFQKRLVQG